MERRLTYKCPSCGAKLRPVEAMDHATQVVRRLCTCGERWQLKVECVSQSEGVRLDKAEFTFLGRK